MPTGRFLKPAFACRIPGSVFALTITARHLGSHFDGKVTERAWGEALVQHVSRRGDRWSAIKEFRASTPDSLRAWMSEHAHRRRVNWIITESAPDALTLSQWWSYAERVGIHLRDGKRSRDDSQQHRQDCRQIVLSQFVPGQRTGIIEYTDDGIRWRWISATNFWPDGCSVGSCPISGGHDGERQGSIAVRGIALAPTDKACILLVQFLALCGWWKRVARAPLGSTAGQLAVGILRSYSSARSLCTHQCETAHRLERRAGYGGRASIWFRGAIGCERLAHAPDRGAGRDGTLARIPGPVHRLDVSAMYATIMRDCVFPTGLRSSGRGASVELLTDWIRDWAVIARVSVRCSVPEYPCRVGDRVLYPVGTYTTTLTGPELARMLTDGEILQVHEWAVYEIGQPFRAAMSVMLDERKRAHDLGDDLGESLCKLVGNSLGGKMAQRAGGWTRVPDMDCSGKWGLETEVSVRSGTVTRWRWICGLAYRLDEAKWPRGPYTFAFAYLAALGRLQMRDLRALCPDRSIITQDTDGLWVTGAGLDALTDAGKIADGVPGMLRFEATASEGVWYGPRHYIADGQLVAAGRGGAILGKDGQTLHCSHSPSLWARKDRRAPSTLLVNHYDSRMRAAEHHGAPGPDGWLSPPVLPAPRQRKEKRR